MLLHFPPERAMANTFKLIVSLVSSFLVVRLVATIYLGWVGTPGRVESGMAAASILSALAVCCLIGLHAVCLYSWHGYNTQVDMYSLLTCICYIYTLCIANDHAKRGEEAGFSAAEKVDIFANGVHYPVSYWTEKGNRPYQEDRHATLAGSGAVDSSLYAVFDGHGGSRAAHFCKENMLRYAVADESFAKEPSRALSDAFVRCDAEFSQIARAKMLSDGTTACVASVHNRRVIVANAGDSRAIIVQSGGRALCMSDDHKPDRADEERRIRSLGGKVVHWGRWRVEGVLAVSRAIGDVSLQPYVTCVPEVVERALSSEDEYLVLASDGVWDVMHNEDVARLVVQAGAYDFAAIAKTLCAEALILGSSDNVTAVVVDLRQQRQQQGRGTHRKSS